MGTGRDDARSAAEASGDADASGVAPLRRRVDKRALLGAQFLVVGAVGALPPANPAFAALLVGIGAYLAFGRTRRPARSISPEFLLRAK